MVIFWSSLLVLGVLVITLGIYIVLLKRSITNSEFQLSLYSKLFDDVPAGLVILSNSFSVVAMNSFTKAAYQKSRSNNIHQFISLSALKEAIQEKTFQLELKLNECIFQVTIIPQSVASVEVYTVIYMPLLTSTENNMFQAPALNDEILSIMAKGLSNELKNPLASIKMLLEKSHQKGASLSLSQFKHILGFEVERLDKIVSDFNYFSDIGPLDITPCHINKLVTEAELVIRENYTSHAITIKKVMLPVPTVKIDAKKMTQVLLNILLNAIEALPETGGTITIQTQARDGFVDIIISDTGQGISEKDSQKVFIPFYTTHQDSAGLGLSISQKIIQAHLGNLTLDTSEYKKTQVIISLPVVHKSDINHSIPNDLDALPTLIKNPSSITTGVK